MRILVPNLGSTSLKFRLLHFPGEQELVSGRMERIGRPEGDASSYREAVAHVLRETGEVDAVGFKAVHAGPRYRGTFRIDNALLAALREFEPAAPLHNGIYLEGIQEFRAQRPGLALVAVLETGFHATVPEWARSYGVPEAWRQLHGIQRYGFHGASHRSVADRLGGQLGAKSPDLRLISCHLGGSSSICAIRNGRSCDISMGFSPQTGLENATRHGELDPFAVLFLMERLGLTIGQMRKQLIQEGGLAGLSGIPGGDLRDIEAAAADGDARSELALATFAYQVRKTIGAYAAAMGGVDVVAFTGGIGENAATLRKRICQGLEFLGLELDSKKNASARPDCQIGRDQSRVACWVLGAQEELVVAREVYHFLREA